MADVRIRRAADRYVVNADGIETRSCFSAGPHYDAENVSFGPVVGVDEHVVALGAGFDWHAHRGVVIWSWVLDGVLRHQSGAQDTLISPGELFEQDTTDGVRHRETNADDRPLRFVQTTALVGQGAHARVMRGGFVTTGPAHLYIACGRFVVDDEPLDPGDSARVAESVSVDGDGDLILVEWLPGSAD